MDVSLVQAERDALQQQVEQQADLIRETSAVCACGCPDSEHENYEEGQSCLDSSHDCYATSKSALSELQKLRAQVAQLTQENKHLRESSSGRPSKELYEATCNELAQLRQQLTDNERYWKS